MNQASTTAGVVSYEEARRLVCQEAGKLQAAVIARGTPGCEPLELLDAHGRVLAEEIRADRDIPPFPRATRDGYAVRSADVASLPAKLTVVAEIKAGQGMSTALGALQPGQTAAIMTGAPVPAGADAVVMVEYTSLHVQQIGVQQAEVHRPVTPGENIVPAGSEAGRGDVLLAAGARLSYPHVALAAAAGKARVSVYRRPRIAILSTGDEVVEIDQRPGPYQIRNSNSYSLAAQIKSAGAVPWQLDIAPDEPARLTRLIKQGLEADLLVLSGGVSMGKYDLVEQILAKLNAEFFFTGAEIQPGRPVVFGQATSSGGRKTCFLGLPGNPVSTMVTFELFGRPLVDGLSGARPAALNFPMARLHKGIKVTRGLTRFLPAYLEGGYPDARVTLVPWRGSGDVVALAQANCFLVVAPDREELQAGEMAAVMLRNS